MDERKLVKSGYSSLVVSLPMNWVRKNKLKAGDKIFLDEQNNNLLVKKDYKEKSPEKKEKVIDVDGKSNLVIEGELLASYLNNYYYVIIKGKSLSKILEHLKTRISELVAFEVIDESSERIVIKNFLNLYDADVDVVIRRMDNIIRSMIIDAKEALRDKNLVPQIMQRDKQVNKLNFLVSKVIKAAQADTDILYKLGLNDKNLLELWDISMSLEKIGDYTKRAAKAGSDLKPAGQKQFKIVLDHLEEFYISAMNAYYANSIHKADEAAERRDRIAVEINEFSSHQCVACVSAGIHAFNMNNHINDLCRLVRYLSKDE